MCTGDSQGRKENGNGDQNRLGSAPVCDHQKGHLWKRGAVTFAIAQINQSTFTSISALQETQTTHSSQGNKWSEFGRGWGWVWDLSIIFKP